jgi:hypothetical protein
MNYVILIILQLVGILTYPPVLISIFTGKNFVKYLNELDCSNTGDKKGTQDPTCLKLKSYLHELSFVTYFYLLAIIFYIISKILFTKNPKLSKILLLIGSIFSIVGVIIICYVIINVNSEINKDASESGDPDEKGAGKYLWLVSSLTLIFSFIPAVLGIKDSIKVFKK